MAFQGEVLKRVFILRKELQQILTNTKQDMNAEFSDVRFPLSLYSLVDIFEIVNSINLGPKEGKLQHSKVIKKLTAFKMKPELWDSKLEKKNFAPFPQSNTYIDENELNVDDDILEVMY